MNDYSSPVLKYISKIINNVNELKRDMNFFSENPVVCYRGENDDYGNTSLMPSVFRKMRSMDFSDRKLLELLNDYDITNSNDDSSLSKAISGQHFAQISRLLDVTFSILPALFFASDNDCKDGKLYSFVFPQSYSPNSNYLKNYYENIVNYNYSPYIRDFRVISHSYVNERIKSQAGGFIMFSGDRFSKIPSCYYLSETIKSEDKEAIRKDLSEIFNINESTIYPERDKRGLVLEKRLISGSNIIDPDNGLKIDNELSHYFKRIEFETEYMSKKMHKNDIEIKRDLRKYEKDLLSFIHNNNKDLEEKYKKIIREKIRFILANI